MSVPHEIKMKVCVIGTARVGKTSLIRRFVYNQFDESYLVTIGATVAKTVLEVGLPDHEDRWKATLMVWDIMGEKSFMDLLKDAYFRQTAGIIAVADLTRPETFADIDVWIGGAREVAGTDVPVVLLGNKLDLVDFRDLDWSPLAESCAKFAAPFLPTSAKAGNNVQVAFEMIARLALTRMMEARAQAAPDPAIP